MTPKQLEEQKKKQEELYDSQYPEEQDDPLNLDDQYIKTMGNDLDDDDDLDIAEEIEDDEDSIQDGSDNQEDPDSLEDFKDLEEEDEL